jgi:uncharacterized lipoprotein YddW (UPF0748 family)
MASLRRWFLLTGSWLVGAGAALAAGNFVPSSLKPPAVAREFRGVWVASVKNIDWPSQPGLTTAQQKSELLAILDRAAQLRFNAVLLQVRPSCDALYESKLEPWSEYLTGKMGQAPNPYYDPLTFAVEEAHRRGLELHAWLNPYRARHDSAISPLSKTHISQTRPSLVKSFGKSLWLDPGEREVQDHVLRVVADIVQRYDIDGLHFDDYFYPYPAKDRSGKALPFPDWSSWKRYTEGGGKLARDDWRRQNVNNLVRRVNEGIKARKPWVRFGISPFGIWRPGSPAQIKGLDSYDKLYADSRRWLAEGWVDYLAPQLYWDENKPETSFNALLGWWSDQNPLQRHVWPGLSASRIGSSRPPSEIIRQILEIRRQPGSDGNIQWSIRPFLENRRSVNESLIKEVYAHPALVPAAPWLDARAPSAPQVSAQVNQDGGVKVSWHAGSAESVHQWVLQYRDGKEWTAQILHASRTSEFLAGPARADAVALTAIDRFGNASPPAVAQRAP